MDPDANPTMKTPPSSSSKRKPGRPPKIRSDSGLGLQHQMPNIQPYNAHISPDQPQFQNQVKSEGGSQSISASLAFGTDGAAVPLLPPTENSSATAKRGRGRPPKVIGSGGNVAVSGDGGIEGVETGSGRVHKTKMMSGLMGGNGGRVKRGRGRPRRIGISPVTVPLSGNVLRPRGRPKRSGRPNVGVNGGGGDGGLGSSRSDRPSAIDISKLIRKPVGRPSKVGSGTAVLVTDPSQLVVFQELKAKYDLLQSKAKQMASVVKPCIDPNHGNDALVALKELEDLLA